MAAINEAQTPLPVPPTGVDTTITEHDFNPENAHYEPLLKNGPQNAVALATPVVANFIPVTATARPWIYYILLANTGGVAGTVILAEPGGNTLTVEVPANLTVIVPSTPEAPIFVSRTAGQITIISDIATIAVTATYVNK